MIAHSVKYAILMKVGYYSLIKHADSSVLLNTIFSLKIIQFPFARVALLHAIIVLIQAPVLLVLQVLMDIHAKKVSFSKKG